jgi:violaxanthin de-epoxidase
MLVAAPQTQVLLAAPVAAARPFSSCWRQRRHSTQRITRVLARQQSGGESSGAEPRQASLPAHRRLLSGVAAAGLAAALALTPASQSLAADAAKVGTCLLESCQLQLAACVADGNCLQDLICLNTCNGRPDESDCQIKCGDLYEDGAVQTFNACAVSDKKCVPQRVDEGVYPVPPECARDKNFDLSKFTGRWYITAGLNPLFDTFPCQEHFFGVPEPGLLYGKINWRVPKADGDFLQRGVVQTFRQQDEKDILLNHGNAYLHYEDDWYILASKPDEYVFIYYIGNNDAWKGYGGAVVYTREPTLPAKYIPELRKAAADAGVDWDKFQLTDNSCPAKPPIKTLQQILSDDIVVVEKDVGQLVTSFGKGFTVLEQELEKDLTGEEREIQQELEVAEKYLLGVEKQYETGLAKLPLFKWLPWFGNRSTTSSM